ncbi:MAG: biosynthetic arginine decarboxylase [Planctomycetes bacterium]|nr:biosynthetic arginine decarboxylase [Planctomycetota bacterium]
MRPWTVRDSEELYMTTAWGRGYFRVGDNGNVLVTPRGDDGPTLDLYELVTDLVERGLKTPLLLRFPDVLADRIAQIRGAFTAAIAEYGYKGHYRGVFPIKVNQQRHVVEEILEFGQPGHLGIEAGSKPELMIALALHSDPEALLICNGIKDREYIELAFLAKKLGKRTVVVADRLEEIRMSIQLAQELGVRPRLGVRARLFSRGAGKWVESTGEKSKFGLSAVELLEAVEMLKAANMLDCLELLHFHIGSQITDIRALKAALREASRIYVELAALGAPMGILDCGGGLGVDYDGSQTNFHSSMNYSLQEYANDVVAAVQAACDTRQLPHPTLTSESGRAIVAHHSILVADVVGVAKMPGENSIEKPPAEAAQCVRDLWEVWNGITRKNLTEGYHDALQIKEESQSLFNLGFLDLAGRAHSERIFWAINQRILRLMSQEEELPEEFENLPKGLADVYYCNWSTFQSTPDHWAVKQLFPTMPIHRLHQRPDRRGILADLTCDSDGKMDRFIDLKDVAEYLHLHDPGDEPYYIGFFLVGAYQEVLGDLHNLFGDTNVVHVRVEDDGSIDVGKVVEGDSVREVLTYVQYDPEQLIQSVRRAAEQALREDRIAKHDVQNLLGLYKDALARTTYLD